MIPREIGEIMDLLEVAYPNFNKSLDDKKRLTSSKIWSVCLAEEDYEQVKYAVMEYIKTDRSGFPPTPGQLRGVVDDMAVKQKKSDLYAMIAERQKTLRMALLGDGETGILW